MSEEKVTATIKAGRDYDVPWLVFNGTPDQIKQQIITMFGYGAHEALEMTAAELVVEADRAFKAQYTVTRDLGGRVIGHERLTVVPDSMPSKGEQEAEATASPEEAGEDALLADIAAATTKAALATLWKRNLAAFKARPELGEAVAARTEELGA